MEWLKVKWAQFINIVSGKDKNWDGKSKITALAAGALLWLCRCGGIEKSARIPRQLRQISAVLAKPV